MNAARADQEWLAPSAVECRDVRGEGHDRCGKTIESRKTQRGRVQDLASFRSSCNGGEYGRANFRRVAYGAKHDFRLCMVGNDIRRASARDGSDIESTL